MPDAAIWTSPPGPKGDVGPPGPKGDAGPPTVPDWAPNTAYKANQVVRDPGGNLQRATVEFMSGAAFNQANWTPLALKIFTDLANWTQDGTQAQYHGAGEGIHITGDPAAAGSGGAGPNLIAIGLNGGGVGLFINNYTSGVGLKITNRNTGNNVSAWGFLLSQNSDAAAGMYLSQESNTAQMPLKIVNAPIGPVGGGGASPAQILSEWRRSQAATGDTLLIRFLVDSALFAVPVNITAALAVTAAVTGNSFEANAAGGYIDVNDVGGTSGSRRFRFKQSSGYLAISSRSDSGGAGGAGDLLLLRHSDGSVGIGGFTGGGAGFGGGQKVLGIPNATTPPAAAPAGGGVLYAEAGALKWKGSGGTVTVIAAA
jgi:hypothetical protein